MGAGVGGGSLASGMASDSELYSLAYDDSSTDGANGSGEKLGRIQFSLSYDFHEVCEKIHFTY